MKKVWLAMGLLALCAALSGCAIVPAPETPRQEEKVLLTVLAGESTSDPGMADLIHERIEKAFPNVELEWENVDWGERFSVRLNAMLSSGERLMELREVEALSIADISDRLGFGEVSYFIKVFKQRVGITPAKYRANSIK